jgi:hypothetical protein
VADAKLFSKGSLPGSLLQALFDGDNLFGSKDPLAAFVLARLLSDGPPSISL